MTVSEAMSNWWSNLRAGLTPNDQQRRILWIIGGMLLVITVMYQFHITRLVLYPFEIIGTVFHEFGHALTVSIDSLILDLTSMM